MRCSESQTTSSARLAKAAPAQPAQSNSAGEDKQAEAMFAALLMGQMMKPFAKAMGQMGDLLVNEFVTQQVAGSSEQRMRLL
jgi:hypothetical protein